MTEALWFSSCQARNSSLCDVFRPYLGSTRPAIWWILGSFNPEYKVIMALSEHMPPPSAKIMNTWNSTSIPPYSLHGTVLNLSTTWSFKHHPNGSIVIAADVHLKRQK
jgi:hypothetical protein